MSEIEPLSFTPAAIELEVGDTISMDVTVKRKWWQLWKPRYFKQRQMLRVTSKYTATT